MGKEGRIDYSATKTIASMAKTTPIQVDKPMGSLKMKLPTKQAARIFMTVQAMVILPRWGTVLSRVNQMGVLIQ